MRDLGLEGGCSAFAWETEDGKHLWGRNYDFDRLAQGTAAQVLPRGTEYAISQRETGRKRSRYACAGVGLFLEGTPILYEGMNEKGLMGGQLYFREHAVYQPQPAPGLGTAQGVGHVLHAVKGGGAEFGHGHKGGVGFLQKPLGFGGGVHRGKLPGQLGAVLTGGLRCHHL